MALARICCALFLSMLVTGSFSAAASESPRSEIRFAVWPQFPPFESRDEQGQLVGLNIELGNALCTQLNVRCTWVDQAFVESIPALEARRFDAIMGIASTPQRRQSIDFSDDLYPLTTRLVARKYSGLVPTARALKGKRLGVLTGSNREAFALAQWAKAGVLVKSFWLNDQLVRSLVAGDIDATLQGSMEIRAALLDTPQGQDFDFVGPPVSGPQLGEGVAIGVRKSDPALREALNRALAQLKHSGEYQRIIQRYLMEATDAVALAKNDFLQFHPSASGLPFSEAVRAGNTLYLTDILGLDARRQPVPGGAGAQMQQAMDMLREILDRHHSSLEQVVKCTLNLTDLDDLPQVNEVYLGYFAADRLPARSVLSVRKLPCRALVAVGCVAVTDDLDAHRAVAPSH